MKGWVQALVGPITIIVALYTFNETNHYRERQWREDLFSRIATTETTMVQHGRRIEDLEGTVKQFSRLEVLLETMNGKIQSVGDEVKELKQCFVLKARDE